MGIFQDLDSTPKGRILVRHASPSLESFVDFLPDDKIEELHSAPLICRILSTGECYLYAVEGRHPNSEDTYTPTQAAAFQLGLSCQVLHFDQEFAVRGKAALAYFGDCIPAFSYGELSDLFADALKHRQRKLFAISLAITHRIALLTKTEGIPAPFLEGGLVFGNLVAAKTNANSPDQVDVASALKRWSMSGCSRLKLNWLMAHPLQKGGAGEDFRSEGITTLSEGSAEWLSRRHAAYQVASERFQRGDYKEILEKLQGKAMTGEELAGALHKSLRSLRNRNKAGGTRGPLDELMEAGLVENSRKLGGFYLPSAPPHLPRGKRRYRRK